MLRPRHGRPRATARSPPSGPGGGDTTATVRADDLGVVAGADTRCRFGHVGEPHAGALAAGAVLPGTLVSPGVMSCVSPPGTTSGALELSLNGQLSDRTASNFSFSYFGDAVLSARRV